MGENNSQDTDVALVKRVQRGEKAAFNLLVIKYQHKLAKLVMPYLHDEQEVKDVVQEAFIKAYRSLPNFRGDSAFYTWLYRIAVNTAKNYLTAMQRRPPREDIDAEDAVFLDGDSLLKDRTTPEEYLFRDELKDVIMRTIEGLPEELRAAITLRELEGLSYEDIAHIVDCPVGTVRSRIFRAREAIENKIRPLLD